MDNAHYIDLGLALLAIILFLRLWFILGRRHDGGEQRPNPLASCPVPLPVEDAPPALPKLAPMTAPNSLAAGIEDVMKVDPSFVERDFINFARDFFKMVVEDFARGDMARVMGNLSPDVGAEFNKAIKARLDVGQKMEVTHLHIMDVDVVAAGSDAQDISITVKIASQQTQIIYDASGQIIYGSPNMVDDITDQWRFTRKLGNNQWILVETGG